MKAKVYKYVALLYVCILIIVMTNNNTMALSIEENIRTCVEYSFITGEAREVLLDNNNSLTYGNVIYEREEMFSVQSIEEWSLPSMEELSASSNSPRMIVPGSTKLKKIDSVTTTPYNRIMCITMWFDKNGDGVVQDGEEALGTGFMVAPDLMLTAAHNLYDARLGYAIEVKIYPGQHAATFSGTFFRPESFIISGDYASGNIINYDWAIVKLPVPLGYATGYFDYDVPTYGNGFDVTVSGYPGGDDYTYYQYESSGYSQKVDAYICKYKCSTLPGMSGSPVFDSNNIVYAIHTGDYPSDYKFNRGLMISSDLCDWIESY